MEASAEDLAAGSLAGRRKLRDLNALLSLLLDLIVIARAIRHRQGAVTAPGHAAMVRLRQAFKEAADRLRAGNGVDVDQIEVAARQLEATDALVSPVIAEMRTLLATLKAGHARLESSNRLSPEIRSLPHPDFSGLRLAVLRGSLAVAVAGSTWLLLGWDPLRYLVLGTSIFTVLFSAADEPVPAVRQVLLGGVLAALAALLWREGIVPSVTSGWLSLGLAVPVVFIASLLQARKGSVFLGLAFNMLFAVLARPVDIGPGTPLGLVAIEAMLLSGIALSYAFFRWSVPMHAGRRQEHLRASIRKEVAAIGLRAGTPWAQRHLARLRSLVFSVSVRSRGDVGILEDALAALSVGHVLLRLGQSAGSASGVTAPNISRRALDASCRL